MLWVFYKHTFIITSSSTYYPMLLHLTENDFSSKMNTWKEDSASHLKWVVTLFRIPAAEIRLADVTSGDKTAGNNSIWILELTLSFRGGPIVILQQKLLGNSTWPLTVITTDFQLQSLFFKFAHHLWLRVVQILYICHVAWWRNTYLLFTFRTIWFLWFIIDSSTWKLHL